MCSVRCVAFFVFFFQAEDGIRDSSVTGVQTCALPISWRVQFTPDACAQALREVEERYAPLKAALLSAGRKGTINVVAMENWLVQLSRTRRLAQQVAKAAQHLHALRAAGPTRAA